MKKNIIIILLLCGGLSGKGTQLEWGFKLGENLHIEKFTRQTIIKDGQVVRQRDIKDLVVLTPTRIEPGNFPLTGIYRSYEKNSVEGEKSYVLTEETPLRFSLSNNGVYTMPQNVLMPTIRNIPIFPRQLVNPGDIWTALGLEIFPFDPPIDCPVQVSYQYLGEEKQLGKNCSKISFSYMINHFNRQSSAEVPYKIAGYAYSTLWHDASTDTPVATDSIYSIMFFYRDGTVIEYKGELDGTYWTQKVVGSSEKGKLKDSIAKDLKDEKEISVRTNRSGIVISLGEVFFDFDSYRLKKDFIPLLDKVGEHLKKNGRSEIIIEGHTDDIGNEEYNQRLSEKRAQATLEYLIGKNAVDPKRGSYIGKGKSAPAYPNTDPINRKKNRRVDIIIKQE